jgi:hypothetical protein
MFFARRHQNPTVAIGIINSEFQATHADQRHNYTLKLCCLASTGFSPRSVTAHGNVHDSEASNNRAGKPVAGKAVAAAKAAGQRRVHPG